MLSNYAEKPDSLHKRRVFEILVTTGWKSWLPRVEVSKKLLLNFELFYNIKRENLVSPEEQSTTRCSGEKRASFFPANICLLIFSQLLSSVEGGTRGRNYVAIIFTSLRRFTVSRSSLFCKAAR